MNNGGSQLALSFGPMGSFPYGYRNWTAVDAHAGGLLRFRGTGGTNIPSSPSLGFFRTGDPAIAAAWGDWRMSYSGGNGTFYWTTTPAFCMATWVDVREQSARFNPSTFQVKLYANGDIELNYGPTVDPALSAANRMLAGIGMGNQAIETVPVEDLAAAITTPFSRYVGAPRMHHRASASPVLGSTVRLSCDNVPDGSLGGLFVIGFTQVDPGLDLAPIGMPLCSAYVSVDMLMFGTLVGNDLTHDLAIPDDPNLAGLVYYSQALVASPGRNAFGAFVSNGVASGRLGR